MLAKYFSYNYTIIIYYILRAIGGFMTYWLAIILGLVQGLTEFLPVSSSGHLTFFEIVFGLGEGSVLYNVILHVATLLALCIVMWRDIVDLIKHPLSKYMRMLLLSTIITGVLGICIDLLIGAEGSLLVVAIGFAITGVLMVVLNCYQKSAKYNALGEIGYKQSVIIGVVQGIAVLPGLSRSGSTLTAGVLCGSGQVQSARYSFLLSIPVIICSVAYEIYGGVKHGFGFNSADIGPMIIGFVVAFISAALTLKWMLKLVHKNKWLWFAGYLFLFAAAIIIFASCTGNLL